jgi:hypothetical protein
LGNAKVGGGALTSQRVIKTEDSSLYWNHVMSGPLLIYGGVPKLVQEEADKQSKPATSLTHPPINVDNTQPNHDHF